ncbi:PREDICTED: cytochrome P450 94B3 [Nelumbo nucifera]|uniref:Cytochrome P450 94B3-like n=2 Tax=Nelumbo nucifera TaxID=4432 RepID=A0A822ZHV7_NELNU|nr:PREDICTED: cytochrome P450 94B3 [Nelumbo nucifera]DAD42959.1 TPA_asm: hypothetical protein HUJ06_001189 [Nelumbo nucifera]
MDLFSLQSLLLFFLLSLYLYLHFHPSCKKSNSNAGFKIYPLIGTLPEFIKNRHRFLDWTTDVLSRTPTNTATFYRPGKVNGIITANPLNVEHMLKANFENYPKGDRFIALLKDFLGQGIFNSDGDLWRVQRKTASFEFNTKSLRSFVMENVKAEIETRLIPLLKRASETNQILDIQDILERFAFDNVCKLAFDIDPVCLGGDGTTSGEFMQAFEEAARLSAGRFMYLFPFLWKVKKALNIGSERRLKQAISTVHDFADKIIWSRMENRRQKQNNDDLLSRFMEDEFNSAEFLRDIVISFILAGRDTTSSSLAWFFWILSSRPDIERNILDELESVRARKGKCIGDTYSYDELREMQYLQAALSEGLRLYPPVAVDTKACREDDVLPDGSFIKKGWFITYHTYAMGRMEAIWGKDCREFKPQRWLESGTCRQESPFRYPIFHAGPRMCLGKDMAYIQMKSIAASVIERFHVDVVDGDKCPEHLLSLTLRIKGGLRVRIKQRCVDKIQS